jgi:hypothetical protein
MKGGFAAARQPLSVRVDTIDPSSSPPCLNNALLEGAFSLVNLSQFGASWMEMTESPARGEI